MLDKLHRQSEKKIDPDVDIWGPLLNREVTYGAHIHRQRGERARVVFIHLRKGVVRVLVGDGGRIHHFPGIAKEDREEIRRYMDNKKLPRPKVQFETTFKQRPDGKILMVWQIQPDGRYWEDSDGFGSGNSIEVCLYSYLDDRGRFTAPFRLYSVGSSKYCSQP